MTQPTLLSIGAVARLTGLSTHSLRKWEDRYGVVEPQRSAGGDRRYSSPQVARLALLKDLVDAGDSISELAGLSTDELKARSDTRLTTTPRPADDAVPVVVVGEFLPALLEYHNPLTPLLKVLRCARDVAELKDTPAEAVIIEAACLGDDAIETLATARQLTGARCVVLLYRFSASATEARLSSETTACLKMPVDYRDLQRTVMLMLRKEPSNPALEARPARYSSEVLARLQAAAVTINCECTRHLTDIVTTLNDFEQYSATCESSSAEDARLHRFLSRTAAASRAAFETALTTLAAHEGIPLEQWQAESQQPRKN
ncbi:MAG: MerR family transcriptional regulator [Pseudomonadota bacterium]